MRSLSSLIHSALFPSTRVYHDANGNYRGTSTDVTPWLALIGRGWGIMVWLYMVWGYCVDWGQNDLPYKYTQPSTHWEESKWEPNPDGSFDEYYKSISEDNPKI